MGGSCRLSAALLTVASLGLVPSPALAQGKDAKPTPAKAASPRQLDLGNKAHLGDFDKMLARRQMRVYAPYSRSLYFVDKGRERGIGAELVRDFEQWINKKYAKQLGKRPMTIYIIAATRDKL